MELVKIEPKEFGIEEKQSKEILSNLPQIKEERKVLEQQYSEVIKMDIENPETHKMARELRLLIRGNRTKGINIWHRNAKDFFLRGGQFVDAIKRLEVDVNERMEEQLLEIEKYAEIQEQKRKDKLKADRIAEIEKYSEFVSFGVDLGELSEEDYKKVFNGAKLQFEQRERELEAERLEEERQEKIKEIAYERKEQLLSVWAHVEVPNANFGEMSEEDFKQIKVNAEKAKEDFEIEQEKIRLENERLKKEAEKQRIQAEKDRKERERIAEIERAKAEKERKEAERLAEIERKEKAELQAKLEQERKQREKAEQEKREEEQRKKLEAERLAKLPVKEKMEEWVNSFQISEKPSNNNTTREIEDKFNAFKVWALKKVKEY